MIAEAHTPKGPGASRTARPLETRVEPFATWNPAPAVPSTRAAEPVNPPDSPGPPEDSAPSSSQHRAQAEPPPARGDPETEAVPAEPLDPQIAPDAPLPPAAVAPEARAPAPTPAPPARVLRTPAAPPAGVSIPVGATPTGIESAHRILVRALSAARPGSVERADIGRTLALWRAYLAPGTPLAPAGRRATVARALRANAWWFGHRHSPARRVLLRDEDGVILTYRPGGGFVVNPVATTGRWRGLNDEVPAPTLGMSLLEMGVERRDGERTFLAWEYYDVEGDPDAIVPGTSGMAQARIALLMAHAAAQSGDRRFAVAARRALSALTVAVNRGGVRSMVRVEHAEPAVPWYVERAFPGEDPWKGAALNGFMVTLLNLQEAAGILDGAPRGDVTSRAAAKLARELADRGAPSLQRHLADHDSGSWSYYGLLTPGRPWKSYLADLNYHCYHVRLLDQLADRYPDLGFGETARRWQGYVDSAGVTCPEKS